MFFINNPHLLMTIVIILLSLLLLILLKNVNLKDPRDC